MIKGFYVLCRSGKEICSLLMVQSVLYYICSVLAYLTDTNIEIVVYAYNLYAYSCNIDNLQFIHMPM